MRDAALVILGVVIGAGLSVVVKAFIDPILDRRNRRIVKREDWTQDAVDHAERVQTRLREAHSSGINQGLLFDTDELARAKVRSLTEEDNPEPLAVAAEHDKSGTLKSSADAARDAWMNVKWAMMDDAYGAEPADPSHHPQHAIDLYEAALMNFVHKARHERL